MKRHRYLRIAFLAGAVTYVCAWFLLPHHDVPRSSTLISLTQVFLAIQSFRIFLNEPNQKNRPIFFNFGLFYASSLLFAIFPFIGPGGVFFTSSQYIRLFFQEYISYGAYFLLLAVSIVYLSVDAVLREFRTWQKYGIALLIVGSFYGYYNWSLLVNPKYLYQTSDVVEWKVVDTAVREFKAANNDVAPTADQIVNKVDLNSWSDGRKTGTLFPEEKLGRVSQLLPYTVGDLDYLILLYRPLYMNVIYLCVLSLDSYLLFFGYQYMKDPPQGAYIERIMFLFLVSTSLEILHAWSFIKSVEWGTIADILQKGQYVSILVLVSDWVCFSPFDFGSSNQSKVNSTRTSLRRDPPELFAGVMRWTIS